MKKTKILKGKTAKIVAGVLTGALLVTAVCGIMGVFNKDKPDTVHSMYAVGGLTAEGKYLDTKESIYTKNAFACEGLKITMDFDNNISYQVYYYDFDSNFIESTGTLTANYKNGVPFNAQTARIVITPNEDDEISWLEIAGYANQLKVEVDKEQFDTYEDKLSDTSPVVLFDVLDNQVTSCQGGYIHSSGTFSAQSSGSTTFFTNEIDVSNASKVFMKMKTSTYTSTATAPISYDVYNVGSNGVLTGAPVSVKAEMVGSEWSYLSFDCSKLETIRVHVDSASSEVLEIVVF